MTSKEKNMIHATQTHSVRDEKAAEYLAGWQRARAELDNFRKKMQGESLQRQQQSLQAMLQPLLQLSDNFHAMTQHVPDDIKDSTWVQGVLHIARQLDAILSEYNVTKIKDAGKEFDPRLHEAIEEVKEHHSQPGVVLEIVQPGYVMGDTVLRPAKVKVAA